MIQRNHPDPAYYEGARDAINEHQNALNVANREEWYKNHAEALAELNALAAEAEANACQPLDLESVKDLVATTLAELGAAKFTEIAADLQTAAAMRNLLTSEKQAPHG